MGISTKVAKRIWQHRTLARQVKAGRMMVTSTRYSGYALVVDENGWGRGGQVPVIVTVLFAVDQEYVREGTTYRVVS